MRKISSILLLIGAMFGAIFLGKALPLLGSSISAIVIGSIIRHTPLYDYFDKQVYGFVNSHLLKAGIVLLGFTLSLQTVQEVGMAVLIILIAVVATSMVVSAIANRFIGTDQTLGTLIGIGTCICGGAAIMATSPVLEAEDDDIAVSITTMFIYSMVALLVLPTLGQALGFTDLMYGILAGSSVNDTASVVATSYGWSTAAGDFATVVKLARTLLIVPLTLIVIAIKYRQDAKAGVVVEEQSESGWRQIIGLVPQFVIMFALAVVFASIVSIPTGVLDVISVGSNYLMTLALVTVGMGVHIQNIIDAGIKPVLLGGVTWLGVLGVATGLITVFY